jgi:LysR family transcriptional regulator, glycine cleavage system transcriptional activator
MDGLPPLNAVRAFEAAARHMSVTAAAEELYVTPGAISRQLRTLEEFLKMSLFERKSRGISLTPRGRQYYKAVSKSLDLMLVATRRVTRAGKKEPLRIRAYTTFALRWLIPRLSSFHAAHPAIEVLLSASLDPVDFSREPLDGAIRLGNGSWPGQKADRLVPNLMAPVCSPELSRFDFPLKTPKDLVHYTLLHSQASERFSDWQDWLRENGVEDKVDALSGLIYESSALAYQAAIAGQGLALAQLVLVEDDLAAGRLIIPFKKRLDRHDFTYYLVTPANRRMNPQMQQFRQWLLGHCQPD